MATHAFAGKQRGSVYEAMARGIDDAAAVVVCVTETYEERDNCMLELKYAKRNSKPLFFLNSREAGEPPTRGAVSFVMGDALYFQNRSEDEFMGQFPNLLKAVMAACPNLNKPAASRLRGASCDGGSAGAGGGAGRGSG